MRKFLSDTRGGATTLMSVFVTIMTLGGAALLIDHNVLVDQRDTLKAAASAGSVAATQQLDTLSEDLSDDDVRARLTETVRSWILANFLHLSETDYTRAEETLVLTVAPDRENGTVAVRASADLGGTFLARHLGILGNYGGPERVAGSAGVECFGNALELVLAIDVSLSMNRKDLSSQARATVASDAARELLTTLKDSACDGVAVSVGMVPWTGTVRLADPAEWQRNGWVDTSLYSKAEDWEGCIRMTELYEEPWPDAATAQSLDDSPPIGANRPQAKEDNDQCVLAPMIPLSESQSAINASLLEMRDAIPSSYGTAPHLGIAWGRRMLNREWVDYWDSDGLPAAANANLVKSIVLLTDGLTAELGGAEGVRPWLNSMLAEACKRARNDGTELYAVSLLPPLHNQTTAISNLLKACVVEESRTFSATDRASLEAAFGQIADRLFKVRLVR